MMLEQKSYITDYRYQSDTMICNCLINYQGCSCSNRKYWRI